MLARLLMKTARQACALKGSDQPGSGVTTTCSSLPVEPRSRMLVPACAGALAGRETIARMEVCRRWLSVWC